MAIKKFFMTFAIIVFVFLVGAGIAMIQVLNTAEARALENAQREYQKDPEAPATVAPEENDNVFGDFFDVDPYNGLIMFRDKVSLSTDAIMLVNFNPVTNKITAMSIDRDTVVSLDMNGDPEKDDIINAVYAYFDKDLEKTIEFIGEELGCNIKYGAVVNLNAFRQIIDQLGGVDFEVPALMDYDDPYQDLHIYFEPGMQHFNGEDAEKLLRFRKSNADSPTDYWNGSNANRIKTQQDFIMALIEQKASILHPMKINSIIQLIFENLDTNVEAARITDIASDVLNSDLANIEFIDFPVHEDEKFIHMIMEPEAVEEVINTYFQSGE